MIRELEIISRQSCFDFRENEIDLKQVINTNNCIIHLKKHKERILITSIIDNLIKGAAGQAIQNMNLIFCKLQKAQKSLSLILCQLKKISKT